MTEEQFAELKRLLEAEKAKAPQTCPSCGYCPHCGRGRYWTLPVYPQRLTYEPPYITCSGTVGS